MEPQIYIVPVLLLAAALISLLAEQEDDTNPTFEEVFGFKDYQTKEERLYA